MFYSAGPHVRHYLINGIVNRALVRGGVAAVKQPNGLVATSSLRPDGTILIPWSDGKYLAWDATAPDSFAAKNIPATNGLAGAAAEQASLLKNQKYNALSPSHPFVGKVVETLGVYNFRGFIFHKGVRHRTTLFTDASLVKKSHNGL